MTFVGVLVFIAILTSLTTFAHIFYATLNLEFMFFILGFINLIMYSLANFLSVRFMSKPIIIKHVMTSLQNS